MIRRFQPACNQADTSQYAKHKVRQGDHLLQGFRHRRIPRRRPPRWRRARVSHVRASPWLQSVHLDVRPVQRSPLQTTVLADLLPGVPSDIVPFSTLYVARQRQHFADTGEVGPLWLWERRRIGLLLARLARPHTPLRVPQWPMQQMAAFLVWAAMLAPDLLQSHDRAFHAFKIIDMILR
eukprot:3553988-Pyramimonas_sp.AAC.1